MTVVTHHSFLDRMLNSCVGCIVGLALFLCAVFLTIGNEGAYVSSKEVLDAANATAQDFSCIPSGVGDDALLPTDGKTLVFLRGCALTGLPEWSSDAFQLDDATGAWFETALEMFQWKETKHSETHKDSLGGGKTTVTWYSHEKGWFNRAQPSPTHPDQEGPDDFVDQRTACDPAFGFEPDSPAHCNPALPVAPTSGIEYADEMSVRAGAVFINRAQMGMLTTRRAVQPTTSKTSLDVAAAPLPIARLVAANSRRQGAAVTSTPTGSSPRVGDVRVRWYTHAARSASVLAAIDADFQMVPWHSGVTAKVPGLSEYVNELQEGDVPRAAFFETLHSQIEGRVWTLRVIALLLFCGGFFLFSRPLAVAPDLIPCIGPAVGDLVGCALGMVSFAIGACAFLVVTALCWLWFRPLVGLVLLSLAAAIAYAGFRFRRHSLAKKRSMRGAMLHDGDGASLPTHYCPPPTAMCPMGSCGALPVLQSTAPTTAYPAVAALPMAQPVHPHPMAQPVHPMAMAQPVALPVAQASEVPVVPMGLPVEEAPQGLPVEKAHRV